jgi:hypothetical protein
MPMKKLLLAFLLIGACVALSAQTVTPPTTPQPYDDSKGKVELQRQVLALQQENAQLKKQIATLQYTLAPLQFKEAQDAENRASAGLADLDKPTKTDPKKDAAKPPIPKPDDKKAEAAVKKP